MPFTFTYSEMNTLTLLLAVGLVALAAGLAPSTGGGWQPPSGYPPATGYGGQETGRAEAPNPPGTAYGPYTDMAYEEAKFNVGDPAQYSNYVTPFMYALKQTGHRVQIGKIHVIKTKYQQEEEGVQFFTVFDTEDQKETCLTHFFIPEHHAKPAKTRVKCFDPEVNPMDA